MKADQLIRLLSQKGMKIINEGNKLFWDKRDDESIPMYGHHAIWESYGKWLFIHVKTERLNTPEMRILHEFDVEDEAYTFFFLYLLHDYFFTNYVLRLRQIEIDDWDFEKILQVMDAEKIPRKYFSYDNIRNKNSTYYYEENEQWFCAYIGNSGEIIAKNENGFEKGKKDWFLSQSLDDVYLLYLLDEYENELLKSNEIEEPFSDVERARFLGY